MDTFRTKRLIEKHQVVVLKADKTHEAPEVDELLEELGNSATSIPFYAVYPADGAEPIVFSGPITQSYVLDVLQQAGPSRNGKRVAGSRIILQ